MSQDSARVAAGGRDSAATATTEQRPGSAGETVTRGERRKARTIAAILEAAEQEILEHGYHGARVEDISERADVAVGSIYAHFESKIGLYLAVLDRALTVEEEYLVGMDDERIPPGERLVSTGQRYARFAVDHPGYFRLLASPPAVERGDAGVPPAARRLLERGNRLQQMLAATVAAGVETGQVRGVDPGRTAAFLWGSWTGVISLHLRTDPLGLSDEELKGALEQGLDIVRAGLMAAPARLNHSMTTPPTTRGDK